MPLPSEREEQEDIEQVRQKGPRETRVHGNEVCVTEDVDGEQHVRS